MTRYYPGTCPACGQGLVHPVEIPALGYGLWLLDECDAIWPLESEVGADGARVGGPGALYALTEAAGIKNH